jgi:hypothetical protein
LPRHGVDRAEGALSPDQKHAEAHQSPREGAQRAHRTGDGNELRQEQSDPLPLRLRDHHQGGLDGGADRGADGAADLLAQPGAAAQAASDVAAHGQQRRSPTDEFRYPSQGWTQGRSLDLTVSQASPRGEGRILIEAGKELRGLL